MDCIFSASPNYAICLKDIAKLYILKIDYINSEINLKKSLEILLKFNANSNFEYATTLIDLGQLYFETKKYKDSEDVLLIARKIIKLKFNSFNRELEISNYLLFLVYEATNNYAQLEKFSKEKNLLFGNKFENKVSYSSTNEIYNFLKFQTFVKFLDFNILNREASKFNNFVTACFNKELLLKNLSLRNQQRIKTSIQKSGDTMLQNNYEQFVANKKQLNKLQELPINKRPTSYEQLNTDTEKLEKELTRQSALFADSKNALSIGWKKVQEKLLPNEVAIDIVAFNYYNKKWTDSTVYAAFVVKKEFKTPKYIPLFEQKQLEFLLNKTKTELDSTAINNHYTNKAISDLFLKTLEQDLKNCTVVYIAPAGLAHQINFRALPVSETVTFGEKYQVHLLGATSELVNYKVSQLNESNNLQLYLYGGIDYNKKENNAETVEKNESLTAESFNELSTRSGVFNFGYLPGTKVEVAQIAATSKQNGLLATVISETNATEESIKKLDGKTTPYVLHFATHGFFFPNTKQELPEPKLQFSDEITKSKIYKTADDPMMRSGLLFAGANKFWGKTTINTKEEDGILTASEISNLDLSACQLVVMSACETGLGQINGSEGVFGLQRAFKMAGVKNIIMSLWKVPDVQTAELFDIFYKTCFSGKSIHDAFQIAQSEMKQKYPPYYWAGFVLLE